MSKEKIKCPLSVYWTPEPQAYGKGVYWAECLQELCAWWRADHGRCAKAILPADQPLERVIQEVDYAEEQAKEFSKKAQDYIVNHAAKVIHDKKEDIDSIIEHEAALEEFYYHILDIYQNDTFVHSDPTAENYHHVYNKGTRPKELADFIKWLTYLKEEGWIVPHGDGALRYIPVR